MSVKKKLVITADDFGLCKEINQGIVKAHKNGFIKSTALLVNAPGTNDALNLIKTNPNLEVGLHLAVVESYLTNSSSKTLVSKENYFPGKKCLHKDWKNFLIKSFFNKIDYSELYADLKMQVELFLENFDDIPFINITQNLQMLPSVSSIIAKLIEEYPIYGIRLFNFNGLSSIIFNKKIHLVIITQLLGVLARRRIKKNISIPKQVLGIEFSGKINHNNFKKLLSKVNEDTCEIVMHPGFDAPFLKEHLPQSYNDFNWEEELRVLCDNDILEYINNHGFEVTKFGEM